MKYFTDRAKNVISACVELGRKLGLGRKNVEK